MTGKNPFPESAEKAHLRRIHLARLSERKKQLGRGLAYLGLPSAEMLDVKLWRNLLDHITAIEREADVLLTMAQTADELQIRDRTTIIHGNIEDIVKLMAIDDSMAPAQIASLPLPEQKKIQKVRAIPHDVVNLDMYGGFLYPTDSGESANVNLLKNLISFQSRHSNPFILLLTFQLRDTGKEEYLRFISDTLDNLAKSNVDVDEVRQFYSKEGTINKQPFVLRCLRFCIPVYLHYIAFDKFQVKSHGAWRYKNFYHTSLYFEPRKPQGPLGTWPPIDETKELLLAPMEHISAKNGEIMQEPLPAPILKD